MDAPRLLLDGDTDLRETHISWVFLTADRAYKLKKPVVLPFLDYGTPERRRAMCEAEVALNRRLAPAVYLGVRALVPDGDGLRLAERDDDPAAVDYAVEMARYDEGVTLAARLRAGVVGEIEIAAIGGRLATFHADAEPDMRADGAEAFTRWLDDNFATLLGSAPDRAAIARLARSAGAFAAAAWEELDARGTAGRIVDGHGDLRLEHVLLGGDGIQFVDCVEFDPELRRIDAGADLAFLVMELHEAGRADLAAVLVHAYRDAGGDPGDDTLLAFFAAYRAEVRAKVSLTRAAQLGGAEATRKRDRAGTLLALAARERWAAAAGPLVTVLAGLSGSGKSTVARALAAASGFPVVSSDVVRKERAGLRPTDRAPESAYTSDVNRATYAALGRAAMPGTIVDATFRYRADRDAFRAEVDAPVLFVECRAPATVLEARARARASEVDRVSDAGVEVVRAQLRDAEPFDEVPASDHVVVRSDQPVARIVEVIADAVDRRVAGGA